MLTCAAPGCRDGAAPAAGKAPGKGEPAPQPPAKHLKRVGRDERGKIPELIRGNSGQMEGEGGDTEKSAPLVAEKCSGIIPAGEGGKAAGSNLLGAKS